MSVVIDTRTGASGKNRASRQRFNERMRKSARDALERKLGDSKGFKDILDGGIDVPIPQRDLKQPRIGHNPQKGSKDYVLPGNKKYRANDGIERQQGGGGGRGRKASDSGDGEDDFEWHLSQQEALDFLMEELELPHMHKKGGADAGHTKPQRAGFVSQGMPNRVDLVRSFSQRIGRDLAVNGALEREIIKMYEQKQSVLLGYLEGTDENVPDLPAHTLTNNIQYMDALRSQTDFLNDLVADEISDDDEALVAAIENRIEDLERRRAGVPFLTEKDLRYRNYVQVPQPVTKAVMFCIMDVSGSVTEEMKNNSKVFYWLLYKFLQSKYDHVETVFIRHTHEAEEVDHDNFFYSRVTGGTVVSPALRLTDEIIKKRYSNVNEWNIYAAHTCDGDNTSSDNNAVTELMHETILPQCQGFFYMEVGTDDDSDRSKEPSTNLWRTYQRVMKANKLENMWMAYSAKVEDSVRVFREFFKKRGVHQTQNKQKAAAFNIA